MKLFHPLFRATKLGLKRSSPVTNSIGKLFFASTARTISTSSLLRILPEVSEALASNKPVVALESTILAHGLPHPENITLANELSSIIRSKGAIPATIAVKDGVCRVGLTPEELNDLALSGLEGRAAKCSTRDLPLILAKQRIQTQTTNTTTNNVNINTDKACQWGATTVASTMYLAHMAGIQTFVTGGTGGVHRGAESTMDVSADLLELARTPVLVVSAGVKSILDIHRTLEMLETNGVPAVAFGRGVKDFPAFFSPSSGVVAPAVVESAEEAAQAFLSSLELGLPNGMLVAVPNQDPAGETVEDAIQETIEEANKLEIAGRDVTPYILKNVAAKTKGESLKSNTALVKGNAAVGADIAVAIANANAKKKSIFQSTQLPVEPELQSASISIKTSIQTTPTQERLDSSQIDCKSRVAVMGGSVIDLVARPVDGQDLLLATSNPGVCHESDGGVGRNIAEVLGRLGSQPVLFSAVGNDSRGNALIKRMKEDYGITTSSQTVNVVNDFNTATYLAVLQSDGDLHTAIADMAVLEKIPIPQEENLSQVEYLVVDANPPIESLVRAAQNARWASTKICFEPTSVPKAAKVSKSDHFMSALSYAFPNLDELFAMASTGGGGGALKFINDGNDDSIKAAARVVLKRCNPTESHLVITMGAKGVLLASRYELKAIKFQFFEASSIEVGNCTGAGDTLAGTFVHSLLNGCSKEDAVKLGMEKALFSLKCVDKAISPSII